MNKNIKPKSRKPFSARIHKFITDHIYNVDHILFFSKPLDRPSKFRKLDPKDTTVVIATTNDEIAPLIASFPERADFFREYIASGITAFYALRNGEAIAYTFVATEDFYDKHLWKNTVEIGDGQFFQFAGYVVPGSRGSIASLVVIQRMHEYYREKGFTTALTTVASDNKASWGVVLKLGFDQLDQAWDAYKLFGLRWSRPAAVRTWVAL